MDPRYSAQDIIMCDLCQKAALQSHCELCQINLCKDCVGEHLSDSSKRHNVVPYKHRISTNYPKCPTHTHKHCELYCEECDIPACSFCISSGKHKGHDVSDALKKLSSKKKDLERDLMELEEGIFPTYEDISLDLNSEKVTLEKRYEKLTTFVNKQGENWHRGFDIIVNKRKYEINEMKNKHLTKVNEQEYAVKQITTEVKQCILDLKKILDSNDASLISVYKSRNVEFKSLPPKFNISLSNLSRHRMNKNKLHKMFVPLSELSIEIDEHVYTMKTPEAVYSAQVRPLLDEPELITTIDTGYKELYSVTCLSDEKIWTCGNDKIMQLFNLQVKLLKSIQTKS
ncbi:E3 ubiquitin-protein ligase TRIM45-like [Saccostrea cucullata]|uniref:E3 ubiquitin-protein ligase TRIM45-like n=1 Tax=Saccostrea cuccullata TaxID=36930 RepID=UPI002ED652CD